MRFIVQGCLVDSNIWVAVTFAAHPQHRAALEFIASASVDAPLLWCRQTQLSFLRLISTPAIHRSYYVPQLTNADAFAVLDDLTALPSSLVVSDEPPGAVTRFRRLAHSVKSAPKVYMDAYLAAWAIAADVTLATLDDGFAAFRPHGLKLRIVA
jgi:toxin-antitoxin system PIN domain toxin